MPARRFRATRPLTAEERQAIIAIQPYPTRDRSAAKHTAERGAVLAASSTLIRQPRSLPHPVSVHTTAEHEALSELKGKLAQTPAQNFNQRPHATGGTGADETVTDC